ncbi:MAG: tandem-95 repeat protein [Verrucomicrobia bacterium]|nr:tandem-95 repeat protein [Verrucomicrobiota bacterium]
MVRFLPLLVIVLLAAPGLTWAVAPSVSIPGTPADIFDTGTSEPFDTITVTDADSATVDVQITFPDERGTFPIGGGLIKPAAGTYALNGLSPAAAQAFLRDLVFTPNSNRIPDGVVETTTFTVTATDPTLASGSDTVDLDVEGVNDPPSVSFGFPSPANIFDNETSLPLDEIDISDPDAGDTVTVQIVLTTSPGTTPGQPGSFPTGADLTSPVAGTYVLSARSPASAEAFLRALVFTPVANRIPVTESELTIFDVTVTDGTGEDDQDDEDLRVFSFNDAPHFTGTVTALINDNANALLFPTFSLTDVDVARIGGFIVPQPVTVTATVPGGEGGVAFGSFPVLSLTFTTTGSPATATAAFQAAVFTPVPNRKPVGQTEAASVTITLVDSLGEPAPENGARAFSILSINDPPTASASAIPATFPDTLDLLPFQLSITDPDPFDNTFTADLLAVSDPTFQFGAFDPASPTFTGTREFVQTAVQSIFYRPVHNSVAGLQAVTVQFQVEDPHGATALAPVIFTIQGINDPPSIVGVPLTLIRISDDETIKPFKAVTIEDPDGLGSQLVSVTITMDDPGKGTFSPAGPFNSITSAAATTAIRGVDFTPMANSIPVGETATVVMTITVIDAEGEQRVNNKTTVVITSVNGTPKILGLPALVDQPVPIPPTPPIEPFAGISIQDDDDPPSVTVTVSLDDPAKGTLANLGGFVEQPPDSGVFKFTGTPADATTALAGLQFEPAPDFLFPPNAPGGTTFTLKAVDSVLNTRTETLSIVLQGEPRNHLVTNLDDDEDAEGTLRHAVKVAANDDVITFALEDYPAVIQLDWHLGPIELTRNVTFKGPGADMLSLSGDSDGNGQPDTQLFRVRAFVVMEGFTLTRGKASTGGAVYVGPTGHLTMRYCAVTDSLATQWGGGLDVEAGSLAMDHCFLGGNSTDGTLGLGGGAVSLFTDQPCSFVNTTFSGNRQQSANGFGGGALYVENFDPQFELPVAVTHCTFAGNLDAAEAGSSIHANVFGTLVEVMNSIFADGHDKNLEVAGAGRIVSLGGNVSDDSTRTILTQGGQPKLVTLLDAASDATEASQPVGPLNAQLRPTPGHPPTAGSAAIGRAVAPAEATDQLGVIRDGDPDSGALEFNATTRLVINEIQTTGSPADFVELYVLRDSTPVNISGYSLWIDGDKKHVFAASTLIQPGFGIVVADSLIGASGTPVVTPSEGSPLGLGERGLVELRLPGDGPVVLSVSYVGVFVDPGDPSLNLSFPTDSLTLAPQFRGVALLPHSIVLPPPLGSGDLSHGGDTSSPGKDTGGTPFGSPNAFPFAVADQVLTGEDDLLSVLVLANDLDADGLDKLVIVDVSTASAPGVGNSATAASASGAALAIDPSAAPLRGLAIGYDPRAASALQQLPEGIKKTDTFHYEIIDIGTGTITAYASHAGGTKTKIVSAAHRLVDGDTIVITGAGTAAYNGERVVTRIDDDSFSIPLAFIDDPATKGSWVTKDPRHPTARSEAKVTVTVLGANDPPVPANDTVATDEETILRIMGDPNLAGSSTVFDTDPQYPPPRLISGVSLLSNDEDIDTDDHGLSLKIVGVLSQVNPIGGYSGTAGQTPVTVSATAHGLEDGTVILIAGYGGHPSYNGYHSITFIDENTFSIPVHFVDNHSTKGNWVILNDDNRLSTTTSKGAAVRLEIRTDRIETSIVYNPRASAYLNGLAVDDPPEADIFYYAAQDSHGAIGLAKVTVNVSGVNDAPEPAADPASLSALDTLLQDAHGHSLDDVLADSIVLFNVPPASGLPDRSDAQLQFTDAADTGAVLTFFITDVPTTDEDTPLDILSAGLLLNDSDVDRNDDLSVLSVAGESHGEAAVSLSGDQATIHYNPTGSSMLNSLAREEPFLDFFEITVTDSHGGNVPALVVVIVIGANDSPRAVDDAVTTTEDETLIVGPPGLLANDEEDDIDGNPPDNKLRLLPVSGVPTAVDARVTITGDTLKYNPTFSSFLNGLGPGQTYVDSFQYAMMDGSFIFANDDVFKVAADGADYRFNVLANDRNLTGFNGSLHVTTVGAPHRGGTAALDPATGEIVYSPEVNFVGNEVFTYEVADEDGNTDRALVTVRVTVNQLNGNLQANADHFTVAKGQAPLLDVLANDNLVPAPGQNLTIASLVSTPAVDVVEIVNNRIRYTQTSAGPFPYDVTFSYEVSGGGTARAIATVRVEVVNREGTLSLREDAFSLAPGTQDNALDVLANDMILPGTPVALRLASITDAPDHGTASVSADGSLLLYTPAAGFLGEDTLVYMATDDLGGTGSALVRISVGTFTINADFFTVPFDSSGSGADDGTTDLDVLANDRVLQTPPEVLTITDVQPPSAVLGTISIGGGGTHLVFNPAVDQQGEAEFTYTVTDATSGRTATGKVTVAVSADATRANPDFYTVLVDSAANELAVLANDASIPLNNRPRTIVTVGTGLNAPNRGGTVVVNDTNDRLLYTPASGFSGEETFTYTMTDARRTDTAKVVVRITGGQLLPSADAFTVFFETPPAGADPQRFVLPVLANDRLLPDTGQVLTITGVGIDDTNADNAPDQQGLVEVSADGAALEYLPQDADGPFPYTERFTYEITDGTSRRADAVVMVTVEKRALAREMETNGDAYSVPADSLGNVLAVLVNDDVKPASAAGWSITEVTAPNHGGVVSIDGQTLLYTPQPGFLGTEQFAYSVSDGVGGTGDAVVTVKVGDTVLCPDTFTALSDSTGNVFDVLVNDAVQPETTADYLLLSAGNTDQGGTVSVSNGKVVYAPNPGYAGPYPYIETFDYVVEDDSLLTFTGKAMVTVFLEGSDRSVATVRVTVVGVNDPPTISGTVAGQTVYHRSVIMPFASVTIADVDEQGGQKLKVRVIISDPTHGFLTTLGGFVNLGGGIYALGGATGVTPTVATATIRAVTFVPTTGDRVTPTTPETTGFTIEVDDLFAPVVTDSVTTVIALHSHAAVLATMNTANHDSFGQSVATSGDIVAVGVPFEQNPGGTKTGTVYIFGRHQGGQDTWGLVLKLYASDGAGGDQFGASVALDGTTLVVAAPQDVEGGKSSGSIYVFERDTGGPNQWGLVKKRVALDADNSDKFGQSVSISGARIAVGATWDDDTGSNSGSAYLFEKESGGLNQWGQVKKITVADGKAGDEFSYSISLSGDILIVGVPFDDDKGSNSGSAQVFERNQGGAGNWGRIKKLLTSDGAGGDQFGLSVAASGELVAAGAPFDDVGAGKTCGSVYVFDRNTGGPGTWGQLKKIVPADGASGDQFGYGLGLDGDTLAVGARLDNDPGHNTGSAYAFGRHYNPANPASPIAENWAQIEKLFSTTGQPGDKFGYSAAVRRHTIVIGSGYDGDGHIPDFAHLYRLKFNNGPMLATPIPDQTVQAGSLLSFTVAPGTFGDADFGETLTYAALLTDNSPLPAWLSFTPGTRLFSGTPAPANVGSIFVKVIATDSDGASATASFKITVTPPILGPMIVLANWDDGAGSSGGGAFYIPRERLHEYAFGATHGEASILRLAQDEQGDLFLLFPRRLNDPRLRYLLQVSPDLKTWHPADYAVEEVKALPMNREFEEAVFIIQDAADATSEFFRIGVTLDE